MLSLTGRATNLKENQMARTKMDRGDYFATIAFLDDIAVDTAATDAERNEVCDALLTRTLPF